MEFPHLQKLVDKYGSKGFVIVTLNVIPSDDATGQLLMTKQNYGFVNLTTPSQEWARKVYGVSGSPTTVLLDVDGKTVLRHLGYSAAGIRAMDQAIGALLERASSASPAPLR